MESIVCSSLAYAFSCPSTQHAPGRPAFTQVPACCREEGSNGDREMAAAVYAAGLEPWDISMSDLLMGRAALDSFAGIVFVGGFSYADVLDSAKGWAGTIRRNGQLWQQFQAFYDRQVSSGSNASMRRRALAAVPGLLRQARLLLRAMPDAAQSRAALAAVPGLLRQARRLL